MASNSRKRGADRTWEMTGRGDSPPKAPCLMNTPPSNPASTFRKSTTCPATRWFVLRSHSGVTHTPPHLAVAHALIPRIEPPENPQTIQRPQPYTPTIRYPPHAEARLCQDFHWVHYPLGLMPYDSWHKFHNRNSIHSPSPFRSPLCQIPRKSTPHIRKMFLLAERLSWEDQYVTKPEKDQSEELTWGVNYELGILHQTVEDSEQIPGGKKSQVNKWHPY